MTEEGKSLGNNLVLLQKVLAGPQREAILGPGTLRLNLLTGGVECGERPVPLEDADVFGYQVALIRDSMDKTGKALAPGLPTLRNAIFAQAQASSFHPFEEWATALVWDGKDRLTGELPTAFGQQPGSIEATFLRLSMRAVMARATRPGCDVHTMLVIVGPQGYGKSRVLAALGGKWFTDQHVDVESKDSWEVVSRHLLLEFGELSAMRGKDIERIKHFLSKRDDYYRAPYARAGQLRLRRCVFFGTTNQADFLVDDTGERRFWPITIERQINLAWVVANREQVFAQALAEINGGAIWHLTPEEETLHRAAVVNNSVRDIWEEPTRDWMESNVDKGARGCSIGEILNGATDKKTEHWNSGDMRRMAAILRRIGASMVRGERRRLWFWGQKCLDV